MIEFSKEDVCQPGIGFVKAVVSLIQGFCYDSKLGTDCNLGKDLSKE